MYIKTTSTYHKVTGMPPMVLWTALPIHDNVGCKITMYYLLTPSMLLTVHVFTCVDFAVQCFLSYSLVGVGATYALLPRLLFLIHGCYLRTAL